MGLDMFVFATDEKIGGDVDFTLPKKVKELHRWRKHPNLHGWMEALYREKGGSAPDFNCVEVALNSTDIEALEMDIKGKNLPFTEGFFFGHSFGNETEDDLDFIKKAKSAFAEGKTVFYGSWW